MTIYWKYGNEYGNMGNLPKLGLKNDKMLGPTVDSSGLQGPPGSSLHWSIAWVKIL